MTRRRVLILAPLVVISLAIAWYGLVGRHAPAGQPALATLDGTSLATLRSDFNRDADKIRVIVLLSPT